MKTLIFISAFLFMPFHLLMAQNDVMQVGPLTSGPAPAFTAQSTTGPINFPDDYFGKWKILFSHPADFTPVCTSEILGLAVLQEDFKKLNTALLVISTDGLNSHIEWVKSIESITAEDGKTHKVNFPLIADAELTISKLYGILQQKPNAKRDIRGVFFIDPDNNIRAFFHYPETVGRNIDEIKRTLIALQTQDKYDVLTPANWQPGNEVLIPSPATVKDAEKLMEKNDPKLRQAAWYMWFKKL